MRPETNFKKYDKAKSITDSLVDKVSGNDTDGILITEWLNEDETAIGLMTKLSDENNVKNICDEFNEIENGREKNIRRLIVDASKRRAAKRKTVIFRYVLSSCAAALAVISFLVFHNNKNTEVNHLAYEEQTIEKPTLILSNGKSIDLQTETETIIDEKMIVGKEKDKLNYKTITESDENKEESFHCLVIPRLQTYTVTLSDGTDVILNANSEIRYPTVFKGEQRKIYLKGEAYFKVAKDAKPFIVNVENIDIKVYGTEFNVNAHSNNQVYTTLVSGSVSVTVKTGEEVMMKPNQLSVVDLSENSCKVCDIAVSQYISWMNGDFIYEDANVTTMLNDVAAWYGVEIYYDTKLFKDITINAAFNRKEPLIKILKSIGEIVNVKFVKTDYNKYAIE